MVPPSQVSFIRGIETTIADKDEMLCVADYGYEWETKPETPINKKEELNTNKKEVLNFNKKKELNSNKKKELNTNKKEELNTNKKEEVKSNFRPTVYFNFFDPDTKIPLSPTMTSIVKHFFFAKVRPKICL